MARTQNRDALSAIFERVHEGKPISVEEARVLVDELRQTQERLLHIRAAFAATRTRLGDDVK